MASEVRELLARLPRRITRVPFGEGRTSFEVQVRALSRSDLEALRKRCNVRELNRQTRAMEDHPDEAKWRRELARQIVGWTDLTLRKLIVLANYDPETAVNGDRSKLDADLPHTEDHALLLIEEITGFGDVVMQKMMEAGDIIAEIEEEQKKDFAAS